MYNGIFGIPSGNKYGLGLGLGFNVFNDTFNTISVISYKSMGAICCGFF